MSLAGLLLAAGAGRRLGTPKALVRDDAGDPFLDLAITALRDGGCDTVTVVLGAAAGEAQELFGHTRWGDDPSVSTVRAEEWSEGMGASLRAGLGALLEGDARCCLVSLVDLPDVGAQVVRRMLEVVPTEADALARATYDGVPGHPVLIGRRHWPGVAESALGDRGARDYLATHRTQQVECGDLATGVDVDHR